MAKAHLSIFAVAAICACGGAPRPHAHFGLTQCQPEVVGAEASCAIVSVYENHRTSTGRLIPLKVVRVRARAPQLDHYPVFYLAGGPGESATELAGYAIASGDNEEHDLVLVDERGTGVGHRLDCAQNKSDGDVQRYLAGPFDPASARACAENLGRRFDLAQYSTEAFVEDLDEVRAALGYDRINIDAGSFGTHAALMYIRRHGEHVRSAYLASLDTLSNRVPLDVARSAQDALDRLFDQCDEDAACRRAYPQLRADFAVLLAKVHAGPVFASTLHPVTGARVEVQLSEAAFADAVRRTMYSTEGARGLPFLVERALGGDFAPFADIAVKTSLGMYAGVPMGLFYAVTCNEFVDRIRSDEIEPATRGSYFGSWRVREQVAACSTWPKTELPQDFFEPFRSDVPTVLVSGDTDPVLPPRWGEVVRSFMTNSIHVVVVGGGHTPQNACTRSIKSALFRSANVSAIDVSCAKEDSAVPFNIGGVVTPH
jgi:pimeloyl-ACP methyl ester carboxylesterase